MSQNSVSSRREFCALMPSIRIKENKGKSQCADQIKRQRKFSQQHKRKDEPLDGGLARKPRKVWEYSYCQHSLQSVLALQSTSRGEQKGERVCCHGQELQNETFQQK